LQDVIANGAPAYRKPRRVRRHYLLQGPRRGPRAWGVLEPLLSLGAGCRSSAQLKHKRCIWGSSSGLPLGRQ